MSDQKDQKGGPEYSVDEILAEYGSGKSRGTKVLDFPDPKPEPEPPEAVAQEPTRVFPTVLEGKGAAKAPADPPAEDKPIPEIVPENVGRKLGAQLHTLLRKADNFADHMYDQAEPDEDALRAEKIHPRRGSGESARR